MARPTAGDFGPLTNVASWISLAIMWLALCLKIYLKWTAIKQLQLDDALILAAGVIATAYSVAIGFQVQNGLGQHQSALLSNQFESFEIANYVGSIFYVISIFFAKICTTIFYRNLARARLQKKLLLGLNYFIALWITLAVFVVAFQCSLPQPWNLQSDHCINPLAFWTMHAVIDIVTQLLVAFLPVYLLLRMRLRKQTKLLAMLSFTPNALTIPLGLVRLSYLYSTTHSSDLTFALYPASLSAILQSTLAVTFACIPFLKPFIDALAIGTIGNDVHFALDSTDHHLGGGAVAAPAASPAEVLSHGSGFTGYHDHQRRKSSSANDGNGYPKVAPPSAVFRGLLSRRIMFYTDATSAQQQRNVGDTSGPICGDSETRSSRPCELGQSNWVESTSGTVLEALGEGAPGRVAALGGNERPGEIRTRRDHLEVDGF